MSLIDFRPALRELLLDNSALSAMVGGSRIYPGQLPQGETATSIVYNQVSDVGSYTLDGPSGLAQQRFQIDAWSQSSGTRTARACAGPQSGRSRSERRERSCRWLPR